MSMCRSSVSGTLASSDISLRRWQFCVPFCWNQQILSGQDASHRLRSTLTHGMNKLWHHTQCSCGIITNLDPQTQEFWSNSILCNSHGKRRQRMACSKLPTFNIDCFPNRRELFWPDLDLARQPNALWAISFVGFLEDSFRLASGPGYFKPYFSSPPMYFQQGAL